LIDNTGACYAFNNKLMAPPLAGSRGNEVLEMVDLLEFIDFKGLKELLNILLYMHGVNVVG